nr:hypothetical protein [uncultured Azospirillum sp.]
MLRLLISLFGSATAITVITTGVIYFFQTDVPTWLPAHPIESSNDAREIAEALSTPPTHLMNIMRFSLYHWQTLIAGLLAFFGGLGALAAAYIGAQALKEQTASSQKLAHSEVIRQEKIRTGDKIRQERQVAAALYCEIRNLVGHINIAHQNSLHVHKEGDDDDHREYMNSIMSYDDIHLLFDAMRGQIGLLPVDIGAKIIDFYYQERWISRSILEYKNEMLNSMIDSKIIRVFVGDIAFKANELIEAGNDALKALDEQFNLTKETAIREFEVNDSAI